MTVLTSDLAEQLVAEQGSDVVIPDIYTSIENYAFYKNSLTSVVIGENVAEIGRRAFSQNAITSVVIPDSVTSIGTGAFDQNNLTSVVIGANVTEIGGYAFAGTGGNTYYGNKLTNVVIPDSVTSIGDAAFLGNQLTDVVIGNSVANIGSSAFYGNRLANIAFPDSVTKISGSAFYGNELTSIDFGNQLYSIGAEAFENNKLTDIFIPDNVLLIYDRVFDDNPIEVISIPSTILKLPQFDLSFFPDDAEIIVRETAPVPTEEDGVDQIASIDNIKTQNKVSTFQLTEPISVGNQDIETLIVGTTKKDKITGTSDSEVLAGQEGKDVLKGGDEADGFFFNAPNGFGKKEVDKIKDFDAEEGDSVLVDKDVFGLGNKVKLKVVSGKKQSKKAAKSKKDFVYDDKKGLLYFNENGEEKGWGDGGLFAKLQGAPELDVSDFTIV